MTRFISTFLAVALFIAASHSELIPDDDGYLPVDYDDPDYYHVSELDDDLPSGRLYMACVSNKITEDPVDVVERELRLGAYPDVIHHSSLKPVVHACIARNRTKSVRLLVKRGASLTKQDPDGWNACHHAAYTGIVDTVKLCHEMGIDLLTNSVGAKYHYLNYACAGNRWGHAQTTRYLLEIGVDPDIRSDFDGTTCMEQYATMQEIKDALIEFGAKTKPIPPKKTKVHDDL
ncbi:hypothetical protein MHU86_10715 [Fragilaria crotonensis]|nr:hypothetical protein MHU86_10715 [Fragilaria crotonensis]